MGLLQQLHQTEHKIPRPLFYSLLPFLLHTDYVFAVEITEKPQTLYDCVHCIRHIIIMNTKQVLTALIV